MLLVPGGKDPVESLHDLNTTLLHFHVHLESQEFFFFLQARPDVYPQLTRADIRTSVDCSARVWLTVETVLNRVDELSGWTMAAYWGKKRKKAHVSKSADRC